MLSNQDTLIQRIHRELLDISDEELELELSEDGHNLDALFDEHIEDGSEKEARRRYFAELFHLQGELVKLQGWVVQVDNKKKTRLNCIHHLLSQMPYEEVELPAIELPQRVRQWCPA